MAWVLVRLKLVLLRAGLRTAGIQGTLGAVFALVLALTIGGLGGGLFVAAQLLDARDATDATAGGFALLLIVWALGPIITAGAEGTLEPHRLSLFPLSARQLLPGLLLAALVGFGGVATVLILFGAVIGMAPASPLVVVTIAAAACQLLLCASMSRLLATAISGAARSRRWRDLALILGPLTALALNVGLQFVSRSFQDGRGVSGRSSPVIDSARVFVRFLPSGPAALAMGSAREGRVLLALVSLAGAAILVVAVTALWGRTLRRVLTSAPASGSLASGAAARPLIPAWAPFLPRGRVGAVAAKELRLTWRDPRQRVAAFSSVFAGAIPLISLRVLSIGSGRVVLLAAVPAFLFGASACNQYGFDGPAHWTNVAVGGRAGDDLLGKNIARTVIAVPLVVVVALALSVLAGDGSYLPAALALAVGAFGITLGLGNLVSIVAPIALPDSPTNVFSSGNAGQGLAAGGPALAVLLVSAVLLVPLALPLALATGSLARAALSLLALVVGAGAWFLGWRSAAKRLVGREPELLAKLEQRD